MLSSYRIPLQISSVYLAGAFQVKTRAYRVGNSTVLPYYACKLISDGDGVGDRDNERVDGGEML